jgi:hypothetical protein
MATLKCERVFEVAGVNRVSIASYSYYEAMETRFTPASSKTRSHLRVAIHRKALYDTAAVAAAPLSLHAVVATGLRLSLSRTIHLLHTHILSRSPCIYIYIVFFLSVFLFFSQKDT